MIDRDELHRLWTIEHYAVSTIARRLGVSLSAVARAVRHYRGVEGAEHWPARASPIRTTKADKGAPRGRRAGERTLPPLPSEIAR